MMFLQAMEIMTNKARSQRLTHLPCLYYRQSTIDQMKLSFKDVREQDSLVKLAEKLLWNDPQTSIHNRTLRRSVVQQNLIIRALLSIACRASEKVAFEGCN